MADLSSYFADTVKSLATLSGYFVAWLAGHTCGIAVADNEIVFRWFSSKSATLSSCGSSANTKDSYKLLVLFCSLLGFLFWCHDFLTPHSTCQRVNLFLQPYFEENFQPLSSNSW